MANLTPMVPGDVPYPQYSVVTSQTVEAGETMDKGRVYTKNIFGHLVDAGTNLSKGIFQAMVSKPFIITSTDEIQVLSPRSRMIFRITGPDAVVGDDVITVSNTIDVILGAKTATNYIGKIFEIYTRNADSSKKKVAVNGDLVIVETVQP